MAALHLKMALEWQCMALMLVVVAYLTETKQRRTMAQRRLIAGMR